MTLREKLELAGYRLRSLAKHMPTDWQKATALSWADDAIRASGMSASGQDAQRLEGDSPARPAPEGGDARKDQSHD